MARREAVQSSEIENWPICDKCGQPVDPKNDAQRLQLLVDQLETGNYDKVAWAVAMFADSARHLYPVQADPTMGTAGCVGSPTRVAKITNGENVWVLALRDLQTQ